MPTDAPRELRFAGLVVCTDASLHAAFGIGSRVGIVTEQRRKDARVVYVDPDRSLWIPRSALRHAAGDEAGASSLRIASQLAAEMQASTLEAVTSPDGALRLIMRHGAITPGAVDALRAKMGPDLAAWKIRPGSMSRLESLFELRRLP